MTTDGYMRMDGSPSGWMYPTMRLLAPIKLPVRSLLPVQVQHSPADACSMSGCPATGCLLHADARDSGSVLVRVPRRPAAKVHQHGSACSGTPCTQTTSQMFLSSTAAYRTSSSDAQVAVAGFARFVGPLVWSYAVAAIHRPCGGIVRREYTMRAMFPMFNRPLTS